MSIEDAVLRRTIMGYDLSEDRQTLTLYTTTGPVVLRVTADCCSQTWIESLDDPDALLGTVTGIEEIEMPDLGNVDTEARQKALGESVVEVVDYYGLKVTTEKGRCVIDYRNESNGYYGGSLQVDEA